MNILTQINKVKKKEFKIKVVKNIKSTVSIIIQT